jgi:hypothetical protein
MSETKLTWDQRNKDKVQRNRQRVYYRYRDQNRQKNKDWKTANPEKRYLADKNWNENNRYKKRAQMIACRLIPLKSACEICGEATSVLTRHHKDYGKPLEVLTLCKPCHRALEIAEPPIYTKQPDIRYYKGYEPVEVLDSSGTKRGQSWPCKVLATGEVKMIVCGCLCYVPHRIKYKWKKKPITEESK